MADRANDRTGDRAYDVRPTCVPNRHVETEIEGGRCLPSGMTSGTIGDLVPLVVVVSGPDTDDEIRLLAAQECYLSQEAARQLAIELLRRIRTPEAP